MSPTGPGKEKSKHPLELLEVNAVLFQVRQAGVVPVQRVAAPAPVAAGEMFCLKTQRTGRFGGLHLRAGAREKRPPSRLETGFWSTRVHLLGHRSGLRAPLSPPPVLPPPEPLSTGPAPWQPYLQLTSGRKDPVQLLE